MSNKKIDLEMGGFRNDELLLKVKTADASGEVEILTNQKETVASFKEQISLLLKLTADKHLRVIASGKLLDPPELLMENFKLQNGAFVHAVVTNKKPSTGRNSEGIIAPTITPTNRSSLTAAQLRGMDSLLLANNRHGRPLLGREEIGVLRAIFSDSVLEFADEHLQQGTNESNEDFRLRAETAWMATQDASSEFQAHLRTYHMFGSGSAAGVAAPVEGVAVGEDEENLEEAIGGVNSGYGTIFGGAAGVDSQGTAKDFMMGIFFGYTLGFLMFYCMWDRNVSQKQKLGIVIGIMLQSFTSSLQGRHPHSAASGKLGHPTGGSTSTGSPVHANPDDDKIGVVKSFPAGGLLNG